MASASEELEPHQRLQLSRDGGGRLSATRSAGWSRWLRAESRYLENSGEAL